MGNDALFGRYWAGDSALHSLDPRTKLAGTFFLVAVILAAGNWPSLAALAAFAFALVALARIPVGQALKSIAPLAFIVAVSALINLLFVQGGQVYLDWGWLRVSADGVHLALFMAARLSLLLLVGSLLTLTTTALDITEAFERLLAPFRQIGVPAHEFAMVMGIALRFLPQFVDEFHIIRTAQLARGAKLASSPTRSGLAGLASLLVPLFASAFRHAETLSYAMDARCYHGAEGRTRLHELRFAKGDAMAAAVLVTIAVVSVALGLFC